MVKWGGYPRISEDPKDSRTGVSRQKEDIREGVQRAGGKIEDIVWYEENDTSAYKKKRIKRIDTEGNEYYVYRVIRPKWQRALADLRSGKIDALMVWDMDRLARDPRDMEDAIEVVQHYDKRIVDSSLNVDLTTDHGQMFARMAVIMGNKSSADTGRRVKRAHRATRELGLQPSGRRAFGWKSDKLTVDPKEAALIREAAEHLLAGGTKRSLIYDWAERGIKTSTGRPFNAQTLTQLLKSPRLAGWCTYHGGLATMPDGTPIRGQWEPILDQDTFDRLQLLFTQPDLRTRKPRRDSRHYLLTGMLRCGVCNGIMYANAHTAGKYYYVCNNQRVKSHGLGGSGQAIDRIVSAQAFIKWQERQARPTADPVEFPGEVRLREIDETIKETLAELRKPGRARSASAVLAVVDELEEERDTLGKERKQWLLDTTGPDEEVLTWAQWEEMDNDTKRPYIEKVLSVVVVLPATKRGNSFDAERLRYGWIAEGVTSPLAAAR